MNVLIAVSRGLAGSVKTGSYNIVALGGKFDIPVMLKEWQEIRQPLDRIVPMDVTHGELSVRPIDGKVGSRPARQRNGEGDGCIVAC
jgi:hypothetical protein